MALTSDFKNNLQSTGTTVPKNIPMNDQQFQQWSGSASPAPTTPGFDIGAGVKQMGQEFGGGANSVGQKLIDIVNQANKEMQQQGSVNQMLAPTKAVARGVGDVAGAVFSPIGAAISTVTGGLSDKAIGGIGQMSQNKGGILDKLTDIPQVQEFVTKHPNVGEDFGRLMDALFLEGANAGEPSMSNIGERTAPQIDTAKTTIQNVPQTIKDVSNKIDASANQMYDAISSKSPAKLDEYLTTKFNKGVRPSVTSAKNPNYNNNALGAVRTIVENKPNLNIIDKYGEATGKVPETLDQFRQAIDQTKQTIFSKYDELQKTAGEAGATIPLKDVSSNLRQVQNNPIIQDLNPEVAKYAQARADALDKRGVYTPQETQDAIKNLNNSLEAFYKSPSYETASKATVDSMVVNNLRKGLDASIENAGGAGYQDLKNQYAQLKAIEKDVVHRSIVDARKNTKGLIDFTDIASGAEAVKGILTLNPADLAISATMKGIKEYIKYINDPNTAIKAMFKAAEKDYLKSPQSQPSANTNGMSNSSIPTNNIVNEGKSQVGNPQMSEQQQSALDKMSNGDTSKATMDIVKTIPKPLLDEWKNNPSPPKVEGETPPTNAFDKATANATNAVKDYIKNPKIGLAIEDVTKNIPDIYKGEKDLTTKILKDLEGKSQVSRQYILDATNRPELKQAERDITRQVLDSMKPDYRYHETSISNLENIKKNGLNPGKVMYGDGVYFHPEIGKGEASGTGLITRIEKSKIPNFGEFKDVSSGKIDEGFAESNVPSKDLQYSKDGGKTWFDNMGKPVSDTINVKEFAQKVKDLIMSKAKKSK